MLSPSDRPSNNRFWPASLAAAAAMLPNAAGVVSAAGSNRNTETTLVWTKSQSTPSSTLRSGGLNEASPCGSAGEGDSSPASMKSRPRKISSIDSKEHRQEGVYGDFTIGRFASYGYNQDAGLTTTPSKQATVNIKFTETLSPLFLKSESEFVGERINL